jgi:hypothetical protein
MSFVSVPISAGTDRIPINCCFSGGTETAFSVDAAPAAGALDEGMLGMLEGSLFIVALVAAGVLEFSSFTSFMLQMGQFPGLSE